MNKYNITAQIYNKFDDSKQTILMCETIKSNSQEDARKQFEEIYGIDHHIVKIYSVEAIS